MRLDNRLNNVRIKFQTFLPHFQTLRTWWLTAFRGFQSFTELKGKTHTEPKESSLLTKRFLLCVLAETVKPSQSKSPCPCPVWTTDEPDRDTVSSARSSWEILLWRTETLSQACCKKVIEQTCTCPYNGVSIFVCSHFLYFYFTFQP